MIGVLRREDSSGDFICFLTPVVGLKHVASASHLPRSKTAQRQTTCEIVRIVTPAITELEYAQPPGQTAAFAASWVPRGGHCPRLWLSAWRKNRGPEK